MLRRSIQIFIAAALLALGLVVGFAVLRLRGPAEAIAEARSYYDRRDYARAITVLDFAERGASLRGDRGLREQLWRLRYSAYTELGNPRGALLDVEHLIADGHDDEPLLLDRIRLCAQGGEGDKALQLARDFLAKNPDGPDDQGSNRGRGLELAGEAAEVALQPRIAQLTEAIERDVGSQHRERVRRAWRAYLYRPDGDLLVAMSINDLAAVYATEPRLAAAWPLVLRDLRDLRPKVQESLSFYQQSLEAGGEPVAAFRGLARAYDFADRRDDLAILCDTYRQRFDHQYLEEAGAKAAWSLVRAGLDRAAIATVDRWLPRGRLEQRAQEMDLGSATPSMLLARVIAAWHIRDRQSLQVALRDTQTMRLALPTHATGFLCAHLNTAFLQSLNGDHRNAAANLDGAIQHLLRGALPLDAPDLLAECTQLRIDEQAASGASADERLSTLKNWLEARAGEVRPRLALARFQLDNGRAAAAAAVLGEAATLEPDNEDVFALRVAAARELYRDTSQDGVRLVDQCRQRMILAPEVEDPLALYLCAETALELQILPVAGECARMAVDAFPHVRLPRLLEARINLRAGRTADAVRSLTHLLAEQPSDEAATMLALEAELRAGGNDIGSAVGQAMRSSKPNPLLRTQILRLTLAAAPSAAEPYLARVVDDPKADAQLCILGAHAAARLGRVPVAEALFQRLLPARAELAETLMPDLAAAYGAWLVAAAHDRADAELEPQATHLLADLAIRHASAAQALTAAAESLEATHPRTANVAISQALSVADPEARNGKAYLLAGRLSARLGELRVAEEHWTAALAFDDTRGAAALAMTRLSLLQQRTERALQLIRLIEDGDAALALRIGTAELAETKARAALEADAGDLLPAATMALLGKPSGCDWRPGDPADLPSRCDLLSAMAAPELTAATRDRLTALAADGTRTSKLLLARANAAAGDGRAALRLHDALFALGERGMVFWREVALASTAPGYDLPPKFVLAMTDAVTSGALLGSPRALGFALDSMAAAFARANKADTAAELRFGRWTMFPLASPIEDDDVDRIAASPRLQQAWYVLDQILPQRTGESQRRIVEHLGELSRKIIAADPSAAPLLAIAARRHLDQAGPHGAILHFLIEFAPAGSPAHLGEADERDQLLGQLALAGADRDPGSWATESIARLVHRDGIPATITAIEKVLQDHPTARVLWQARAELLARIARGDEGLADLRRVLAHGSLPPDELACVTLAAIDFANTDDDSTRLAALPANLLASPAGAFARGMMALRRGDPDSALVLFGKAPPREDGLHLLVKAEAYLQSHDRDGIVRAQSLLQELAKDYPSSELARNAGSFARQLEPR